jgi:hypothetical protein
MCDQCRDDGRRTYRHGHRWSTAERCALRDDLDIFLEMEALIHQRSKTAIFLRLSRMIDEELNDPC